MRVGLKTKIAVVIIIPLLIEAYFLSSLMGSLKEIKKQRVAENSTIETLVMLDTLLNDTVACGHVMLFRPDNVQIYKPYLVLLNHHRAFKKSLRKPGAPKTATIEAFVEAVEGLVGAAEQTHIGSADDVWRLGLKDDVQKSTWKIATVGEQAAQELSLLREQQSEKSSKSEEALRNNVLSAAVGAAMLALLAVAYVLREFGTAFDRLMLNTEKVAKRETLLPPMKGKGELSRLDALIHSLSDELEEARQHEKALVENSSVLMCSLLSDLTILELSPAVEKLLQFRQFELRGESLLSFIAPDEKHQVAKTLERVRQTNTSTKFECRLKTKQRKYIFSELTVQWSERDQIFFCTAQDTTARKEAEKLKAEVVAIVSHDLRSPLSSLLVSVDMMNQGLAGEFNEDGKLKIKETRTSIVSLMALINDLIDAEKFESDSYVPHYEVIRIKNVLSDLIGKEDDDAKWKDLKITLESEDLDIRADLEKLTRVIKTFLINAIRRSPSQGAIKISCKRVQAEGTGKSMLELRVEDYGEPIAEEELQQVFERFSGSAPSEKTARIARESASVNTESKLRFVLCRAIIEAHDGEIGIETSEDGSTILWFRIPIQ